MSKGSLGPNRSALIVWGGWDGHSPQPFAERVSRSLASSGFTVRQADSLAVLGDEALLQSVALIVPIWTMGELAKEEWNALERAVRGGVGFAGFHGGMCDAFRTNTDYQFLTGGQFVRHPGGIIDYEVRIVEPQHPIMQGLANFRLKSEQYYMHVDPSNHVLATTTFSGEHEGMDWIRGTQMPVVWTRSYGKGRVFYASYGHAPEEFDGPEAMEIIARGLVWAAARSAT